jgi:hypothetical protein
MPDLLLLMWFNGIILAIKICQLNKAKGVYIKPWE